MQNLLELFIETAEANRDKVALVEPGQSCSAAFIVGYFDSIDEMQKVYDQHKGHTALEVTKAGWKLVK